MNNKVSIPASYSMRKIPKIDNIIVFDSNHSDVKKDQKYNLGVK